MRLRIISTLVIFSLLTFFFFPIRHNVMCKPGSPCPPILTFIPATNYNDYAQFLPHIAWEFVILHFVFAALVSFGGAGVYRNLYK